MEVKDISFLQLKQNTKDKEGIVCLGAGGDPQEWIDGVTKILNEEKIATGAPEELWNNVYKLTTTGGRTDLVFVSDNFSTIFNVGRMAIWRLKFGDCSWISDYLVNYKSHF